MSTTNNTLQEKKSADLRKKAGKAIIEYVTANQRVDIGQEPPFMDAVFHLLDGSRAPQHIEDINYGYRGAVIDLMHFFMIPEINKKWEERTTYYSQKEMAEFLDRLFFFFDRLQAPHFLALMTKYSIDEWHSQSDEELEETIATYQARTEGERLLNSAKEKSDKSSNVIA